MHQTLRWLQRNKHPASHITKALQHLAQNSTRKCNVELQQWFTNNQFNVDLREKGCSDVLSLYTGFRVCVRECLRIFVLEYL